MKSAFLFPFQAMGTRCCFHVHATTEETARQAVFAAAQEIFRLEGKYSRYEPGSYLSKINEIGRSGTEICVDNETAYLLDIALEWHLESGGLFDITSGALRKLWHFKMTRLPTEEEVANVLSVCGLQKLHWAKPHLEFSVPGMELDLGGIVKEYAADRAAAMLIENGATGALVDLGGDICVVGATPENVPWTVGIRNPFRQDRPIALVQIGSGGVATSGDYERFFELNGTKYSHALNPLTGWPVECCASVSTVSDTCLDAGRQSTIALLMGTDGAGWLERQRAEYLMITEAGEASGPLLQSHKCTATRKEGQAEPSF